MTIVVEKGCPLNSYSDGPSQYGYLSPCSDHIQLIPQQRGFDVSQSVQVDEETQCIYISSASTFSFSDIAFQVDEETVKGGVFLPPPPPPIPPPSSPLLSGMWLIIVLSGSVVAGLSVLVGFISYFSPEWGAVLRDLLQGLVGILKNITSLGGGSPPQQVFPQPVFQQMPPNMSSFQMQPPAPQRMAPQGEGHTMPKEGADPNAKKAGVLVSNLPGNK